MISQHKKKNKSGEYKTPWTSGARVDVSVKKNSQEGLKIASEATTYREVGHGGGGSSSRPRRSGTRRLSFSRRAPAARLCPREGVRCDAALAVRAMSHPIQ